MPWTDRHRRDPRQLLGGIQDPEQDLFVTDANFRAQSEPLLALPGQIDELKNLLGLWSAYRDKRNEYEDLRQDVYADAPPPTWNTIWHGNDNALLSIFRQFDSASVRRACWQYRRPCG